MMNTRRAMFSAGWQAMVLSSVLLLLTVPLCVNASYQPRCTLFISNSTDTNSTDLSTLVLKSPFPNKDTSHAQAHILSRKPRSDSGSGGETSSSIPIDSSADSTEDLTETKMDAQLPPLAQTQNNGQSQGVIQDSVPLSESKKLQADGTLLEPSSDSNSMHSQAEKVVAGKFDNPSPNQEIAHDPPAWFQALQGIDPTSWTDFYDYLSPDYSPTEVYLEESQPTPPDMEDVNVPLVARAVPSNTRIFVPDDGGSGGNSPESSSLLPNSGCLPGFVRKNGTCVSSCDAFTSYCFNGGQCYTLDGIGAFCRCNIQEFIWNKGTRCESMISDFQVMCIAVGAAASMLLLLFMVIVFFSKRLHVLKTENIKLRRHSKYRPKPEPHMDNFSLSTVAEGSQANVRKLCDTPTNLPHACTLAFYDNILCQVTLPLLSFSSFPPCMRTRDLTLACIYKCTDDKTMSRYAWEYKLKEDPWAEDDANKEEPCKCPSKEDESLNNQNSFTAKLENDKLATEDNAEEGGVTIDLELLLPKEAKVVPETNPPLHYNVFLYKLPKSPKESPVLRRPGGRPVQGRPLSQLCPRRRSEPGYSPISTRSLPGVLSGSSIPQLGTAYTP
ncbi:hypothetical protein DNTS_005592 [Danionella cerebrum]|uniref:Neural chondroitin sulphate proteoglycan cytoplasmic domain-containing protein n=1 Tax=Danionella cerebrum TaxID=2873325 RepID=A0A553NJZ0_9TELE|nr:hypothetical protein DNTS_005592 [Danionella translucida]